MLFWPVFLEQTAATFVNIFSTIMVSSVSEAAVAGVGMIGTVNMLVMNAFTAIGTGVTVIIAQCMGAGKRKEASDAAAQSLVVVTYISVIVAALMFFFDNSILRFLFGNAEEAVILSAREYMRFSVVTLPLVAIFNTEAGMMRAVGDAKSAMAGSLLSNAAYLLAAYPCINMFNMGASGAGWGLTAARLAPALFLSMRIRRGVGGLYLPRLSPRLNFKVLLPVLRVALPSGIDAILFHTGRLMVQVFISGMGTAVLAANAIVGSLSAFFTLPGTALQIIIVTIVGHNFGAKQYRTARKNMLLLTGAAMAACLIPSLICAPFTHQLLGIYGATPEVAAVAYTPMLLMILATPFTWPPAFILPSALRATGGATFTMFVSVSSMMLLRVMGAWFLGVYLGWGFLGVWMSMITDWLGRSAFFIPRAVTFLRRFPEPKPEIEPEAAAAET